MYIVVDLYLKNGLGNILNCCIFPNDKDGEISIHDKEEVEKIINNKNKMIKFQNRYVSGKTHIDNLLYYKIHEINEEEF